MQGWMFPYFQSRLLPGDFHPLITYLFTESKCNLDCHYCWAYDNHVSGMTEQVAKRSIAWLHSTTCRVLALMGGEVLIRPQFAHKVIDYARQKGFWVYLPTNGRMMKPDTIDRIADAGVGSVNLAVDAWDVKPGLPKAMAPIRKNFDYLVRQQHKYGYTVSLNINICRNNLEDVRMLRLQAGTVWFLSGCYHRPQWQVPHPNAAQPASHTRNSKHMWCRFWRKPLINKLR